MKRPLGFFAICAFLLSHGHLLAGPVSLEADEILQLRLLVKTNTAAAEQFSQIVEAASSAVGDDPDPIAFVVSEGHLRTDPQKIKSSNSMRDMGKIANLAWAWAGSGDPRYLAKVHNYLMSWAKVNKPDGDAINETQFEPTIVAYDLVRSNFSPEEQSIVDGWLRSKAETLRKKETDFGGNWPCHRLKIVGLIGLTLGDKALIADSFEGFRKQVEKDIRPDGSCSDFYVRDAMHYQLYSVEPLLTLARAGERYGEPMFDYQGSNNALLHSAVDFVVPFADGTETHIEFLHSKSSFDLQRAANGEKEYKPHPWDPRRSIQMFCVAGWFNPKYGNLAAKIAHRTNNPYFNWQLLINSVSSHGRIHA